MSVARIINLPKMGDRRGNLSVIEQLDRMLTKLLFFAFASGEYTLAQVDYLRDRKLVPMLVDGLDNGKDHE